MTKFRFGVSWENSVFSASDSKPKRNYTAKTTESAMRSRVNIIFFCFFLFFPPYHIMYYILYYVCGGSGVIYDIRYTGTGVGPRSCIFFAFTITFMCARVCVCSTTHIIIRIIRSCVCVCARAYVYSYKSGRRSLPYANASQSKRTARADTIGSK